MEIISWGKSYNNIFPDSNQWIVDENFLPFEKKIILIYTLELLWMKHSISSYLQWKSKLEETTCDFSIFEESGIDNEQKQGKTK